MATWTLAPCLAALRSEINAKYPTRDKASDGTIGDPAHSARESDHNPCQDCPGVQEDMVHAIDIDSNGAPGVKTPLVEDILRATIGDQRVWYVIWDGKIYSRTYGWAARIYTGANKHDHHVHISCLYTAAAVEDTSRWLAKDPAPITSLPSLSLGNVKNAARHPLKPTNPIAAARVQRALTAAGYPVKIDGIYGRETRQAMRRFKAAKVPGAIQDGMPGVRALTVLGRNTWRLTP